MTNIADHDPQRIHVIYVAGTSYSGSTILGAVLAMHPEIEAPGEIHAWIRDRSGRKLAEGLPLEAERPFWVQIQQKGLGSRPGATWETFRALIARYEGYRSAPVLAFQKWFFKTRAFEAYVAYTKTLLQAIADVSGKPIIVDTSKRPFRILALSLVAGIDLTCIHLIKSPATYFASIRKRQLDAWLKSGRTADALQRQAVNDWLWNNALAEVAMWISGKRGLRVKYEDFACAPAQVIGAIGAHIGMDLHTVAEHVDSGGAINTGHILGSGLVKKGPQSFVKKPSYQHTELQTHGLQKWLVRFFERRYGYR